jgi:uncharacterized protein YkwD
MKKQFVIIGILSLFMSVELCGCSMIQDVNYLTKEKIDVATLELKIHNLVNKERQNNGLPFLQYDTTLAEIARRHSEDMVSRNFFDHVNPDGLDPTARAKTAGYNCYKNFGSYYRDGIGENIGLTPIGNVLGCGDVYSMDDIADCCVSGWMNSPGHRQNILDSSYDKEGIGIAVSSDDKVYITQDFW